MEQMYNVSSNPHVRDKMTTSRIMQLVVIALLPATLFGIWNFGFRALLVVLVTVASSVFFEWLYNRLMHKKNTINDFSAVVTGLLLALNMPPQIPLWMPVLGSNHRSKTAFRRSRSEFHEPGTCCKMFPDDFFCRQNDQFRSGQAQRIPLYRYRYRCDRTCRTQKQRIYSRFYSCQKSVYW